MLRAGGSADVAKSPDRCAQRKEVLLLTCSTSKHLSDARKLLAKCLDPPKAEVVTRAEEWLLANQFIERQPLGSVSNSQAKRGTALALQPTLLGQLLDCMPLDLEASKLVLLGALHGLLEEAVILAGERQAHQGSCHPAAHGNVAKRCLATSPGAPCVAVLRSSQPMPLKREPNKQREYEALIKRFGPQHRELDAFVEDEMLANLTAFLCFQRWQRDPCRLRRVRRPVAESDSELEGEVVLLGVGLPQAICLACDAYTCTARTALSHRALVPRACACPLPRWPQEPTRAQWGARARGQV